ncbi:MAG: hypothetical protein JO190_11310 [Candidatus Eremiobacteraeota bacterium]|nr:hypothetical protein [Candidatus Eremiobacteraeota bacterium]MBV8499037.1 hypothetical protein [Candidatus Eremiobacteraeota bacterium]
MKFLKISTIAGVLVALYVAGTLTAVRAGTLPDITGTWYAQGNVSKRCHIEQSGLNVSFVNEIGDRAHGVFTNPTTLSASWPDWHNTASIGPRTTYIGHISGDLMVIHWSNGTYWTRHPH